MKFAWKIVALVVALLSIALSLGGYLVVRGSFQSQLRSEIADAQSEFRLLSTTVQALCLQETGTDLPHRVLQGSTVTENFDFRLEDATGTLVLRAGTSVGPKKSPAVSGTMVTELVTRSGKTYLVTSQYVTLGEMPYLLSASREATPLFDRTQSSLSRFLWAMLAIVALGALAATALSFYLTRPLRRIARTARQLAAGQYDKRVRLSAGDELGQLARDFDQMAEALQTQMNALADAAQRQREFTASFAHELKTPLTSVIGYADTLRSRQLPPPLQMQAADYIVSEGRRLEAMSRALLDLFALDHQAPAMKRISAAAVAASAQKGCEYLLRQGRITLRCEVEDSTITAAPELLVTLLYNLIDNARKASQEGSAIILRGQVVDTGYRFTVTDRGCGIPPEALSRLTEAFYMVDKSRARAQGGAGLGLALCSRIAALHGGALEFSSEMGKGTSASFTIGGPNL